MKVTLVSNRVDITFAIHVSMVTAVVVINFGVLYSTTEEWQ